MLNIARIKATTAGLAERIIAFFREPQQHFAGALDDSKWGHLLALAALPLWLTPQYYDRYFRHGKAPSARKVLMAASTLWFGTMTTMSLPIVPHLQSALAALGNKLGYWSESFSEPVVMMLVVSCSFIFFMALAAMEWGLTWLACLIDNARGRKSISPPPFGFFGVKVAGDIAGLALCASALMFSIRPENAFFWTWLKEARGPQMLVMLTFFVSFWLVSRLKTNTIQACGRQIYGSWSKSVTYRLGMAFVLLGGLWLLTVLHG